MLRDGAGSIGRIGAMTTRLAVPSPSLLVLLLAAALPACFSTECLYDPEASRPAAVSADLLPPLREQAALRDGWLAERFETVLPAVMRRAGLDCWIVAGREDNEDPVLETMLPTTWLAARRRTILVFFDRGVDGAGVDRGIERLAVARYAVGDLVPAAWDPEAEPDQWACLARLVAERDPARIGLDVSTTFGEADGLTASERDALLAALGPLAERVVSAEAAAVGWLETRTEAELVQYRRLVAMAHRILREGLSERAIEPGVTTTEDLQWWFRERLLDARVQTWFHPSVSVQRADGGERSDSFADDDEGQGLIRRGDLVHVDFGLHALGLHTDTQQHAYVLREGESAPPAGLVAALAVGNALQDALTDSFVTGRTGNQILAAALERAAAEGIDATIYTHPLGHHGHGAGPTIGMWDDQDGTPGRGDYPLFPMTTHSIELNAEVAIPEWGGQRVKIMLEEDALFDGERVTYLDGRQRELFLVR